MGLTAVLLVGPNSSHGVLYTPEAIHKAFEAMVRNFIDLVEQGDRRTLRVTRTGIRRESLAEYTLFPLEEGTNRASLPTVSTCYPIQASGAISTFRVSMRSLKTDVPEMR